MENPDPNAVYVNVTTKRIPVNHFRRMLRIHRKKGMAGVTQYITDVCELEDQAKSVKNIGGIDLGED